MRCSRLAMAGRRPSAMLLIAPLPGHGWHQQSARSNVVLALSALAVGGGWAAAAAAEDEKVQEHYTGCAFETSRDGLTLVGMDARYKYGMFAVYAYAIYTDASVLYTSSSDEALFRRLIECPPDRKLLMLVFQRNITGQDLQAALHESLMPRLKTPEAQLELKEFFSQFPGLQLVAGSSLEFSFHNGIIETKFNGASLSKVRSPSVSKALLDVYLGSNPISTQFKPSIVKTRAMLMKQ